MNERPDDGISFDPKTWLGGADPATVTAASVPASTATGGRTMVAFVLSALLLAGGAASAYLTRATAGAPAVTAGR